MTDGAGTMVENVETAPFYDAVVVGAGIAGMYQLYSLRKQGLSVHCFEAGGGVGGTWYWNRYPGARFDSESWSYAYSWSPEVINEWDWKEHFAAQPEILEYLNFVADKHHLKKDITFNARIKSAVFDEESNIWAVQTESGQRANCRFLVFAVGMLSAEMIPNIKGRDTFKGRAWHTSQWEHDPNGFGGSDMGLAGKRVAVIGTGATGIQVITELSKTVGQLYVFQLSPDYALPLRNTKISKEEMGQIRADYPQWFAKMRETPAAFIHGPDPRKTFDVSPEEQEALFEEIYAKPGFAKWVGAFSDSSTNPVANEVLTKFMRKKISDRINDPELEQKLIPNDHGFGLRRVPMESGYYEAIKRDNVELIAISDTPIEEINKDGVKTRDKQYDVDAIIFATGFDACTGMFKRIDIRGIGGQPLMIAWDDGPVTYLGLQVAGFPNMFTLVGPHNGATFCNIPRCIEQNVEWVTDFIKYLVDRDMVRAQPSPEAQANYTKHVYEEFEKSLISTIGTWWNGANVEGKKRRFLSYSAGMPNYRKMCDEEAAGLYSSFDKTMAKAVI